MTDRKLKTIFLVSRIFPGKADSVIVEFRMYYKPTKFDEIVGVIFEKSIFLCELPLNFGVGGKLKKKGSRYLQEDTRYRILTRSVFWFRLYDRQWTDRQTHTHTHTHKHFF